jgi:hypothetical protein
MKSYHATVLAASVLGLCAFSQCASAATVSIANQLFTGNAPLVGEPSPASQSGNFLQSVTGSISNVQLSPYAFNTGPGPDGSDAATNAPYSVLGAGGGSASATYNLNSSSFTLLWGSPDPYNQVAFFSGSNGTGMNLGEFAGNDLSCFTSSCGDTGFDLVAFEAIGGNIGSVILTDAVNAAFEFGFDPPPASTPLPAALPLFATGLGASGLLGWRRKRKNPAAAIGA